MVQAWSCRTESSSSPEPPRESARPSPAPRGGRCPARRGRRPRHRRGRAGGERDRRHRGDARRQRRGGGQAARRRHRGRPRPDRAVRVQRRLRHGAGVEDPERVDPEDVGGPLPGPHLRRPGGAAVDDRQRRGLPAQHRFGRRPAHPDRVDVVLDHQGRGRVARRVARDHPHHQGIRVSVLCPQAVRTNIVKNSPDNLRRRWTTTSRAGSPAATACSSRTTSPSCASRRSATSGSSSSPPEVATYEERKATDRDRWLAGMRRFQTALYPDGPLPGDAIAPT